MKIYICKICLCEAYVKFTPVKHNAIGTMLNDLDYGCA